MIIISIKAGDTVVCYVRVIRYVKGLRVEIIQTLKRTLSTKKARLVKSPIIVKLK